MSHDDLDGLGEYLSEFTTQGDRPSSLGGYGFQGFGAAASGWDVEAVGRKPPPTVLRDRFACKNRCDARYAEWTPYKVKDIQRDLIAVGALKKAESGWGSATRAGWVAYSQTMRLYPEAYPASGGTLSGDFVWINKLARADLSKRAAAAPPLKKTGPATNTAPKTATPDKPASTSAGDLVTSTTSVQDILVRLGWRDRDKTTGPLSNKLTDGTYGSMTAGNWAQSAKKRKLDPSIAKKTSDGRQVVVREKTFLELKAVADGLVPPEKGAPAPTPAPSANTVSITEKRLTEVLARVNEAPPGATATWPQLVAMYQDSAKRAGLDVSIEKIVTQCVTTPCPPDKVIVAKSTWDAFVKAYDSKAPAPPPPAPAEKTEVEKAEANVKALATTSLPVATLKKFFNIAIKQGVLKRENFSSDSWSPDYSSLIVTMLKVDGPLKTAWEQQLVVGKLVAKDKKSVKLPPQQVSNIKKTVSDYEAAQKAETARIAGYTKVNTATVIETVNKLGVSSKQFDVSGGGSALADALKTFYENTKRSVPAGDLVKTVAATKDVFVLDAALKALADEKQQADARKQATEKYRKSMVAEAFKASSATVSVDDLQRAIIETVYSGKAGSNKALYSAVKRNGTFDSPTRSAYTELAREQTIGPAVQQFQSLLQQQLGPSFKTSLVTGTQNDVWSEFLKQAVVKTSGKLTLKTLPAIASDIEAAARIYKSRVSVERDDAAKKAEADKLLVNTVKKSNVIISLFDAQMGVLEPSKPKAVGVTSTGRGDEPTKVALFNLIGDKVFGTKQPKEKWSWDEYLDAVGIRVESASSVKKGWAGANWVALPQAAADLLSKHAALWLKRNAPPAGYSDLAPVPLSNQELRLRFDNPSVITVKRPATPDAGGGGSAETDAAEVARKKKLAAEKKQIAADKKKIADAKKKQAAEAKKLADAKRKLAEEKKTLAAKNAADVAAQEAARKAEQEAQAAERAAMEKTADSIAARTSELIATKDAQSAQSEGGEGGEGGQASGGQGGATGPITFAPTISVTGGGGGTEPSLQPPPVEPAPGPETPPVEPVTPTEAGILGGNMWLWLLGGAGLYLLRDKGADGAPKTKYSAPSAGKRPSVKSTRRTTYARTRRTNRGARRPGRARP